MSPRRWEQLAAGSGVVFALLAMTGMLIGGGAADEDAAVYFVESRGRVLVQGYLFGLALIFFLLFLGALHHRLRLPEGEAFSSALFGGGILVAGGLFVSGALNTALAAGIPERVDPWITRSLYAVSVRIVDLIPFWIAAFVGSAAILILRDSSTGPVDRLVWSGGGCRSLARSGGDLRRGRCPGLRRPLRQLLVSSRVLGLDHHFERDAGAACVAAKAAVRPARASDLKGRLATRGRQMSGLLAGRAWTP
jgi:hypothetical protein